MPARAHGDPPTRPAVPEKPPPTTGRRRERDWAWRRRLRARPGHYHAYRLALGTLGLLVVVVGLLLVPFPGPGWLIVFIGVGVLASEFHWARQVNAFGHKQLHRWTTWLMAQRWWVRGCVAAATALFVGACFWALFKVTGLPAWTPEPIAHLLHLYLAL